MPTRKQRYNNGSRARTKHLPALSPSGGHDRLTNPPQQQPRQPPPRAAPYVANLKDEALYLASILCARLSDPVKGGDGRGLLSRALARGELDQFLVAFFSDPANLSFAREKVEARRIKIGQISAERLALLKIDGRMGQQKARASSSEGKYDFVDMSLCSTCSSSFHPELCHGSNTHGSTESRSRFGPVLADSAGNFNFLPARDMVTTAVWPAQGDDSHGNDVAQAHHQSYQSGHLHRQQNEVESVRSYGSLSTDHTDHRGSDDDDRSSCCSTTTSLGHGSAMMDKNERRNEQKKRQGDGRRYRHGSSYASDNTPVPTAENIHFEGHLLHRICEVTGKFPGGGSTGNGSEGESSEESLLEDSGEHQLARLRRNPRVKEVISRLKSLSTSLIAMSGRGMASG
ncbi:unnamed protein product, partial [Ectocarpus sp. 8 AP-2014]